MKTNQKRLGDVGIRLKPNEPNLLENYTKFRRITRKKKKRKKKKKKKTVRSIEIHRKTDPFFQIIEDSKKKDKQEISVKEKSDKLEKSDKEPEIKKVRVEKRPQDLSEKDPNVKNLVITASTELDQKKKGSQIKLE